MSKEEEEEEKAKAAISQQPSKVSHATLYVYLPAFLYILLLVVVIPPLISQSIA